MIAIFFAYRGFLRLVQYRESLVIRECKKFPCRLQIDEFTEYTRVHEIYIDIYFRITIATS